ncbi:hypothetical protein BDN67DRAFT_912567, partial [Paxillus ammoniavirescens]
PPPPTAAKRPSDLAQAHEGAKRHARTTDVPTCRCHGPRACRAAHPLPPASQACPTDAHRSQTAHPLPLTP